MSNAGKGCAPRPGTYSDRYIENMGRIFGDGHKGKPGKTRYVMRDGKLVEDNLQVDPVGGENEK